jgi:hypothetical protein
MVDRVELWGLERPRVGRMCQGGGSVLRSQGSDGTRSSGNRVVYEGRRYSMSSYECKMKTVRPVHKGIAVWLSNLICTSPDPTSAVAMATLQNIFV